MEPLSLSHQNLLQQKFSEINCFFSECSFAGLYLFRHIHDYKILNIHGEIFIKGITRDKIPFIMLTSLPTQIPHSLLQEALTYAQADVLFPIPEEWLPFFHHVVSQSIFNDADNDYLYTRLKLATYSGRHLDGKRNQVKHFLNDYEAKSETISQQFNDLQQILDQWQAGHGDRNETDYFSCQEAIHQFHLLNLHGHLTYVNQYPSGFIIGEWISQDVYVVHFSKALPSFKGLYQYQIQELAQSLEGSCSWINLEPDLGIPALRYSKTSYYPDLLIKKWRVQPSI